MTVSNELILCLLKHWQQNSQLGCDPLEGRNKEQGTINPVLHTINQKQSRLINYAYGLEIKFDLREP
jgi:hypothetical protein